MSIYASLPAPDDTLHEDGCAIYVEVEPHVFDFSGEVCDCGQPNAPMLYRGSHVPPSEDDPRGGLVDLACIAMDDHPEPFLRLGVNEETVVLDRRCVELVHRTLSEWLEELP